MSNNINLWILNRLLSATGRESDTQEQNDYLYADAPIPGSPNANNVRAYTRKYTYDKIGNILKMQQIATGNSFTRNFVYNTGVNTLQKIETGSSATIEAFTYDSCGNQLTAGTSRHYAWDAANQLQVYKNQAGSSNPTVFAQYQYAGGSRVSKMVRTGTDVSPIYERIIYIDGVFEYHKLENGSTYEKNYVHVMDDQSRIAMVRVNIPSQTYPGDISESVTYILEDQIGSSVARLDTDGSVIDKEEYYPFGDSSLRTFTKKSYRYVGKEKDAESGLYYYGARYYSAWTCRFISVDPLASKYPNLSGYLYAYNNPIMMNDPTGMEGEKASSDNINSNVGGGNKDGAQQHADNKTLQTGESSSTSPNDAYTFPEAEIVSESKVTGSSKDDSNSISFDSESSLLEMKQDKTNLTEPTVPEFNSNQKSGGSFLEKLNALESMLRGSGEKTLHPGGGVMLTGSNGQNKETRVAEDRGKVLGPVNVDSFLSSAGAMQKVNSNPYKRGNPFSLAEGWRSVEIGDFNVTGSPKSVEGEYTEETYFWINQTNDTISVPRGEYGPIFYPDDTIEATTVKLDKAGNVLDTNIKLWPGRSQY